MQTGTATKTHMQTSTREIQGREEVGGLDPGDETCGGSAQDTSEQGSTGDWKRVDQPEQVAVGHRPTSGRLAT